jgi:hypothetical protein
MSVLGVERQELIEAEFAVVIAVGELHHLHRRFVHGVCDELLRGGALSGALARGVCGRTQHQTQV